jgi:hypothetical protein
MLCGHKFVLFVMCRYGLVSTEQETVSLTDYKQTNKHTITYNINKKRNITNFNNNNNNKYYN